MAETLHAPGSEEDRADLTAALATAEQELHDLEAELSLYDPNNWDWTVYAAASARDLQGMAERTSELESLTVGARERVALLRRRLGEQQGLHGPTAKG